MHGASECDMAHLGELVGFAVRYMNVVCGVYAVSDGAEGGAWGWRERALGEWL